MMGFILARLVRAIVVLVFTVTLVFVVLRLSGDLGPADVVGSQAGPEALAAFRTKWGFDRSIY